MRSDLLALRSAVMLGALSAVRPITTCNLSGFGLTKQWAAVKTLSLSIKVPPQKSSSNASPGLILSKSAAIKGYLPFGTAVPPTIMGLLGLTEA